MMTVFQLINSRRFSEIMGNQWRTLKGPVFVGFWVGTMLRVTGICFTWYCLIDHMRFLIGVLCSCFVGLRFFEI